MSLIFPKPRPLYVLLEITMDYSWQLLCAQHQQGLFNKCKLMGGVATLPRAGKDPDRHYRLRGYDSDAQG